MYSPNDIIIAITPIWNQYGGIKILPNQEYRVIKTVSNGTDLSLDVERNGDIIKDVSAYCFYSLKEKMMFGMCLQKPVWMKWVLR